MTSQSGSYIESMNDNMLQSNCEMMEDYKDAQSNLKDALELGNEDDIAFFVNWKKGQGWDEKWVVR